MTIPIRGNILRTKTGESFLARQKKWSGESYRAEQVRLENEMNLAYQVYTSVAQQLQIAEAKVQEITPVYTIVEPATIPVKASKPSKARKHPISRLDGRLISIYFCDKLKIPIYVTIQ